MSFIMFDLLIIHIHCLVTFMAPAKLSKDPQSAMLGSLVKSVVDWPLGMCLGIPWLPLIVSNGSHWHL